MKKIFPNEPDKDKNTSIQDNIKDTFTDLGMVFNNATDQVRNFVNRMNEATKNIVIPQSKIQPQQKETVSEIRRPEKKDHPRHEEYLQYPVGGKAFGLTRIPTVGELADLRESMILGARKTILSTRMKIEEPELKAAESIGRLDLFRTMFSPTGVISQGALMALMFPLQMSLFGWMRRPIDTFNDSANKITDAVMGFIPMSDIGNQILNVFKTPPIARYENIMVTRQMLRSSLGGEAQASEAMSVAMKAAREFPMKFDEILQSFRSLSVYPTVKPLLGDKQFQDDLLKAVSGLAVINPMQGVGGALFSIVEALSGSWRSMQFRFNISSDLIAAMSGFRKEEMVSDPVKLVSGLRAFIEKAVGLEALEASKYTLSKQIDNIDDAFTGLVNNVMEASKVYPALTKGVLSIQSALGGISDNKPVIAMIEKFFEPITTSLYQAIGNFTKLPGGLVKEMPFEKLSKYIEEDFKKLSPKEMRARFKTFIEDVANTFSEFAKSKEFVEINRSIKTILSPIIKTSSDIMGQMLVEMFRSVATTIISEPMTVMRMITNTMIMGAPIFAGLGLARKFAETGIKRLAAGTEAGATVTAAEATAVTTAAAGATATKAATEAATKAATTEAIAAGAAAGVATRTQQASTAATKLGQYFKREDLLFGAIGGSFLAPTITSAVDNMLGTKTYGSMLGEIGSVAAIAAIPGLYRMLKDKIGHRIPAMPKIPALSILTLAALGLNTYSNLSKLGKIDVPKTDITNLESLYGPDFISRYKEDIDEYLKRQSRAREEINNIEKRSAVAGILVPFLGAAVGGKMGALIGTSIAPGIGTAIGFGVGFLLSSIYASRNEAEIKEVNNELRNRQEYLGKLARVAHLEEKREELIQSGVSEESPAVKKMDIDIEREKQKATFFKIGSKIEPTYETTIDDMGNIQTEKIGSISESVLESLDKVDKINQNYIGAIEGLIQGLEKRTDLEDVIKEDKFKELAPMIYMAKEYGAALGMDQKTVEAATKIMDKVKFDPSKDLPLGKVKSLLESRIEEADKVLTGEIGESLENIAKKLGDKSVFKGFADKYKEALSEFDTISSLMEEETLTPEEMQTLMDSFKKVSGFIKQFDPAVASENLANAISSVNMYTYTQDYRDVVNKSLAQQRISLETLEPEARQAEAKKQLGYIMAAERGIAEVEQKQFLQNAPLFRALGNYGFSPEGFYQMAPFGKKREISEAFEKEFSKVMKGEYSPLQKLRILESYKGAIGYEKYLEEYNKIQDNITSGSNLSNILSGTSFGGVGELDNLANSANNAASALDNLAGVAAGGGKEMRNIDGVGTNIPEKMSGDAGLTNNRFNIKFERGAQSFEELEKKLQPGEIISLKGSGQNFTVGIESPPPPPKIPERRTEVPQFQYDSDQPEILDAGTTMVKKKPKSLNTRYGVVTVDEVYPGE